MRGEGGGRKWRVIGGKYWVEQDEETNKHFVDVMQQS